MSCVKTRLKGTKNIKAIKTMNTLKKNVFILFVIVLIFLPLNRDLARNIYCVCLYIFSRHSVFVYCNGQHCSKYRHEGEDNSVDFNSLFIMLHYHVHVCMYLVCFI